MPEQHQLEKNGKKNNYMDTPSTNKRNLTRGDLDTAKKGKPKDID